MLNIGKSKWESIRYLCFLHSCLSLSLISVCHPLGSQYGDWTNVDLLFPTPVAWGSDFDVCPSGWTVGASFSVSCVASSWEEGDFASSLPFKWIAEGFSNNFASGERTSRVGVQCRSYSMRICWTRRIYNAEVVK